MTLADRLAGPWTGGRQIADFVQSCQPALLAHQSEERFKSGNILMRSHFTLQYDNEAGIQAVLFPTVKLGFCAVRHHGCVISLRDPGA
jgi:hypothetical protein